MMRSYRPAWAWEFKGERHVADADLVIGSVLVPGAAAPKVVTEESIK